MSLRPTLRGHGSILRPLSRSSTSTEVLLEQVSDLPGLPRSNNLVELDGWYNGFQTLESCSNPTLWTFLTALKEEENLTFSKKVKMPLGEGPEPGAQA